MTWLDHTGDLVRSYRWPS